MSCKLELDLSYDYEGNKLDHPFKVLIDQDNYGILIKFKDLPHSFHEHEGWSDRILIEVNRESKLPQVAIWNDGDSEDPVLIGLKPAKGTLDNRSEPLEISIRKIAEDAVASMGDVFYDPDEYSDPDKTTKDLIAGVIDSVERAIHKALSVVLAAETSDDAVTAYIEIGGTVSDEQDRSIHRLGKAIRPDEISCGPRFLSFGGSTIDPVALAEMEKYLVEQKIPFDLYLGDGGNKLVRFRRGMDKPISHPTIYGGDLAVSVSELMELIDEAEDLAHLRSLVSLNLRLGEEDLPDYEVAEIADLVAEGDQR